MLCGTSISMSKITRSSVYIIGLVGFLLSPGLSQAQTLSISSLSPTSGPVGTQVTITGSGFTPTGNKVKFGNLGSELNPSYNLNSSDGTTLVFAVPSSNYAPCWFFTRFKCYLPVKDTQPGIYPVSVINASGTSNEITFTVI